MTDGSYHVSSFAASTQAEIRRLDAQVDLFWRSELNLLKQHGLRPDMEHLDCGCGPGRLIELMKTAFPGLRSTGLEMDPILVDAARQRFRAVGYTDCDVILGTAENSGLPEGSFDFITMRLVLEHVPDPLLALGSMKRLLKPGGKIFIISNDFEYHTRTSPPVPELDALYDAYCASRRRDGGDPCIGRRVPRLLKEAGFSGVAQEVEVAHSTVLGDEAFLRAEGVGIPAQLVSSGFLDQAVFEQMIRSWKAMLADPAHCIMRQLFIAVGENRAEGRIARPIARQEVPVTSARPEAVAADGDYSAPGTEMEEQLARIWCEAMRLDRVSVRRNFFDLGGDSLMLAQVQTAIRDGLGQDLQLATLFQYPTIESLAAFLAKSGGAGTADPASGASRGDTASGQDEDDVELQARRRREAMIRKKRPDQD